MRKIIWFKLRLVMSLIFLWAFVDKLFGLGFATKSENSWLNGGSPTSGYLLNATQGPLGDLFKGLAGVAVVDWLFMMGLLFVGLTLLINRYVMWGAVAGSLMMALIWLSAFPPANNPILDEHIVYMLVLVLLAHKSKEK
jgi:thiosulfate dehydrogenase (quinone) large subunit